MATYGVPRDKLRPKNLDARIYAWIGISFAVMLVLLFFAFNDRLSSTQRHVVSGTLIVWFVLMFVGVYFLAVRSAIRGRMELIREQDRFFTTEGALIRHRPEDVDVTIRFDEITYITESEEWLKVHASTGWIIHVPRDVAGYDELRATLAHYKSIQPEKRSTVSTVVAGALAILVMASLMLMILTHDHEVRVISACVLVATLTLQTLVSLLLRLTLRKRAGA